MLTISKSIPHGKNHAITAHDLAILHNCTPRDIQRAVEHDRRQGGPICAGTGETKGFYMAETPTDLLLYCKSLDRRLTEITKTRDAIRATLSRWQQGEPPTTE